MAVGHGTWKCSAARTIGQPSSTTRRVSINRPRGVKTALAWTTKVSCSLWVQRGSSSTPRQETFTHQRPLQRVVTSQPTDPGQYNQRSRAGLRKLTHTDAIARPSTLPARLSKHPGMSAILIAAARLTNELDDRYINISRRRKSPEEHAPMTLRGLLRVTGQSHASKGIDAMAVQPFRSYTHAGFHPDNWDNRSP